jgi:hypothetical protein
VSVEVATRLVSPALLVPALAVAAALVLWLYRRDRSHIPRPWGAIISGLRLALVLLAVALLSDPVLLRRETVVERGEVLVAIDASRSFSLADLRRPDWQKEREALSLAASARKSPSSEDLEAVGGSTRRDLTIRALEGGLLDRLRERFRVSLFALGKELLPVSSQGESAREILEAIPEANAPLTRLDLPFGAELARREPRTVAGVVLFTDGHHRGPGDPREAALAWAGTGIPFVAVGVGALELPPDLALERIDGPARVFAGDDVTVEVTLRSSGLPPGEVPIVVSDGAARVSETSVSIVQDGVAESDLAGEGVTARASVRFPAGAPGRRKLTFVAHPPRGDVSAANDARDLWLEVLSAKAKVILLDRGPRWEERYLRGVWSRDPNVALLAFRLTPPPERRLPPEFPRDRDALFAHDVVVLGDVGPEVFGADGVERLRDFVSAHGGTLVAISGEEAMPYGWTGTPLEEILPVELLRPAPPPGAAALAGRDGLPLALTRVGEASDVTRLLPGREMNVELWELLPPPFWVCPIAGLRPGAEPLARVAEGTAVRFPWMGLGAAGLGTATARPEKLDPRARRLLEERSAAIVAGVHGAGRVLHVGLDSTWRWRYGLGDELVRRFWGQVVRWAIASRLPEGDAHVRIGTDRLVYEAPSGIVVEAFVATDRVKAFEGEFVDAIVRRLPDGKEGRVRMDMVPRSGGRYRATLDLDLLGVPPLGVAELPAADAPTEYAVRLEVPEIPGYSELEGRAAARFAVRVPSEEELGDLACDEGLLREVARAAGGTYLPFWRFPEVEGLLRDARTTRERVTEIRPWDRPLWVALALLGLLAAEWILRKRRDLI